MQLGHRLLSGLFAIIAIVVAGIALALALGWAIPQEYLQMFLTIPDSRWIMGAVSVLVILLALYLIAAAGKGGGRARELMIQDTSYGRVDITSPALEDLIHRACHQVREIRDIRTMLRYEDGGVAVALHLKVSPEANIPVVSQGVQETVQGYLEDKAGIHVRQVKVLIEGVSSESRARVE